MSKRAPKWDQNLFRSQVKAPKSQIKPCPHILSSISFRFQTDQAERRDPGRFRFTLQPMGFPLPMVVKQVMHSSQRTISSDFPARIFPAASGSAIIWRPMAIISIGKSRIDSRAKSPSLSLPTAIAGRPAASLTAAVGETFAPAG
jgi:hypothetical protein